MAFSRGHLIMAAWVAGLLLAYVALVFISPTQRCRCEPGKERLRCRRCKGAGRHYRPGAVMVHRFYWSVAGDRLRERRRDEIDDLLDAHNERNDQP